MNQEKFHTNIAYTSQSFPRKHSEMRKKKIVFAAKPAIVKKIDRHSGHSDQNYEWGRPVPGMEEDYACDTLLLSVGLIPENELSRSMGVEMDPVTSGPVVNESLETNIPGVFACGNVLHVHDLVDYVSEEATRAGENAAGFASGVLPGAENMVPLIAGRGVRYCVPGRIDVKRMAQELPVRFRADRIYREALLTVRCDGRLFLRKKKRIMKPGEMEEIFLRREELCAQSGLRGITIAVEEE